VSARRALLAAGVLLAAVPAAAEPHGLPVPAQVIYPGDKITAAMLVDAGDASQPQPNALLDRADIIGKMARRTLLPGHGIPAIALEEPRAVTMGALAPLVYEQDGLSIVTTAQALQNGAIGQIVQARNLDSGVVVTGVVQPDGSIRVKGG
jgi:flagellar basal body P-ring formation protein FlgA